MTPKFSPGPLTREEFDLFWEQGYVVVRGVLTREEVQHYGRLILDLLPRDLHIPEYWKVYSGRIKPFYTPGNQSFDSPEFIPLWQNPILYAAMAQIIGYPRLLIKDGSVGITMRNDSAHDDPLSHPLHLDAAAPDEADNFLFSEEEVELGGCYYLTDVEPRGGGVHVVPGGHRIVEAEARAVANGRQLHDRWCNIKHLKTVEVTGQAGDFVVMHHLMPHAASHNHNATTRLAHFFRYWRDDQPYRLGDRPGDPHPGKTYNDLQQKAMSPLGRKLLRVDPW
ncbi:phytanoyl-CoA dioxygenase family protein [Longispora sp. NPDC051575]|uniref:phytanoyl-CoA dioxygenase family protein n=1 Tax=Longispora sp. NPDC051575 TaxID=3154943 RepID=UPI003433C374